MGCDLMRRCTVTCLGWQLAISLNGDRGEEMSRELVEISEEEAEALIERFRQKWADG